MTAASNRLFMASVQNNLLIAKQEANGIRRTLCMIDQRLRPSFYIDDGKVICRDYQSNEFTLDIDAGDPVELMSALEAALLPKPIAIRRHIARLTVAALLVSFGFIGGLAKAPDLLRTSGSVPGLTQQSSTPLPPVSSNLEPATLAAPAPAKAWTLQASGGLPENLRKAADRKLFTVDYSSDHPRTVYVFADPACPNCQRVEPLLRAASEKVNVVVFPVSIIGKQKSIASITPVLCLPPEARKEAWASLFDVGRDGLSLGQDRAAGAGPISTDVDLNKCDIAKSALGVNEVAYMKYKIPGTPWVIADDGRHVPQAILSDATSLEAFLSSKGASDAAE